MEAHMNGRVRNLCQLTPVSPAPFLPLQPQLLLAARSQECHTRQARRTMARAKSTLRLQLKPSIRLNCAPSLVVHCKAVFSPSLRWHHHREVAKLSSQVMRNHLTKVLLNPHQAQKKQSMSKILNTRIRVHRTTRTGLRIVTIQTPAPSPACLKS